jgi:hypothetical protein
MFAPFNARPSWKFGLVFPARSLEMVLCLKLLTSSGDGDEDEVKNKQSKKKKRRRFNEKLLT